MFAAKEDRDDHDQNWTPDGKRAVCERWPGTPITLRQGAPVIEDSRRLRMASWSDKGQQGGF